MRCGLASSCLLISGVTSLGGTFRGYFLQIHCIERVSNCLLSSGSGVRIPDGSPSERGSTFGTVFLDCPKSRPSFYLQSLAIQGFCRDKLLVRIWTLKYKQLKMAIEAAENLESEPLFPEIELLLFPKKCVLILLWRLKV